VPLSAREPPESQGADHQAEIAQRDVAISAHEQQVDDDPAGLVVAVAPRFGGLLVAGWLGGIIVNLLLVGGYGDIALRDFGLMIGALALWRLASAQGD